jgi:uncharacterized protein involved in response to NO
MKRMWRMVLEEPYRVFFPLGVLAGIWGVMMWPMFYGGWLKFYPGESHTRMMIEGFMSAFVLGFLGTAFPRLAGNRSWFGGEFLVILGLWLLTVSSHALGRVPAGDAAFCVMLLALFAGMAGRWIFGHRDTPPPGFLLAFAGIIGAAVAAGFLATHPSPTLMQWHFARLWLFQGFLLLPLMGIGPYVLPRFFGETSSHSFDDSPRPPAGWWRKAGAAFVAMLMVAASFGLEVSEHAMAGQLLRAALIFIWFAMETPAFRRVKLSTTPGNAVRWAFASMVAGLVCAAVWPLTRVGSLHLFFVSGLGLVTLAVGARVILGHAGRHDLLGGEIVWLRWVIGLVILAATTRMSSDFMPNLRVSHHIYAALTWAIAALVWLAALTKYLLRHEDDAKPKSQCPRRKGR